MFLITFQTQYFSAIFCVWTISHSITAKKKNDAKLSICDSPTGSPFFCLSSADSKNVWCSSQCLSHAAQRNGESNAPHPQPTKQHHIIYNNIYHRPRRGTGSQTHHIRNLQNNTTSSWGSANHSPHRQWRNSLTCGERYTRSLRHSGETIFRENKSNTPTMFSTRILVLSPALLWWWANIFEPGFMERANA